jgi:hypothetical protein
MPDPQGQPIVVDVPGVGSVEFPAGTSEETMQRALQQTHAQAQATNDPSVWDQLKQAAYETSPVGSYQGVRNLSKQDIAEGADVLPSVGGAVGGVLGGAGGTVAGVGFGGVPGAMGGAALGGAGGELARQGIRTAVGAGPLSLSDAAKGVAGEAAMQGALEGAGGLAVKGAGMVARPLMENAIRPAIGVAKEFPNIVETAIRERLPVGKILPGAKSGSQLAGEALGEASQALKARLQKFGMLGVKFDASQVTAGELADVLSDISKQPVGDAEAQKIADMTKEFLARHSGPLNPMQLKELKSAAQDIASPIYEAMYRGDPVGAEASTIAKFNSAIASGAKKGLETLPGVGQLEGRTQELIGAQRAIRQAELRRMSLMAESVSSAAGIVGSLVSPDRNDLPSDVKRGVTAWLVTRGLMSPKSTSRAALALTRPQVQALFRQFPRLAYAVVHDMTSPEATEDQ